MKKKEKVLKDYLEYKSIDITTEKALRILESYIKQFINSNNKSLNKFEEKDIIKFFNKIKENYSGTTSNNIRVLVKSFIKWYFPDWSNKFRNLDKLCKIQKQERSYDSEDMLTKKDIEKLVQAEHEPRWKCYWLMLFYGGFRPKELCELQWENITFDNDEAFVTLFATKNKKKFEKYLPSNAVFYLKKLQNNGSIYVFPTKRKKKAGVDLGDRPMTTKGVWQHLKDIAPSVFDRHINPYILRHSIATILYNKEGIKDDDVAQQLGHSTKMKEVYSHPSRKQIREKMKRLYIKAEELPATKKHEFEQKIELLEKRFLTFARDMFHANKDMQKYFLNKKEEHEEYLEYIKLKPGEKDEM